MTAEPFRPLPPRALVIGESLVDLVVGASGEDRRAHAGGSPMNVSVGLSKLGVPTCLATSIGDDSNGRLIARHLEAAGVALAPHSVVSAPTSSAVATLDESGAARYDFDLHWAIPVPAVDGAALVHAGSIGAILEPGAAAVRAAFANAGPSTLLSFDPNVRPQVMGRREEVAARVEALASRAHVVKMSDEDAAWLYPGWTHADVAERYAHLGVALFALTRGPQGCFVRAGEHELSLTPPKVVVADTIGAGDAFMSGMLYAILASELVPDILGHRLERGALEAIARIALASAAVTVSRPGANPPNAAELKAVM